MLTDLGLQTPEQIAERKEFLSRRAFERHHGCISSLVCDSCKHLISDSICLCVGIFTCPNCGFRNGAEVEKMMKSVPTVSPLPIKYTDGVKFFVAEKIQEDYSI